MGGPRKPPPLPDHRDRSLRPSMAGVPPFRGNTSSIPLPKGPPPPQATPSHGGTWIRPPSHLPPNCLRSPSPDPNAMQIDEDPNSPEDSLRIADD
uniref:WH2 domain-containing protein n=1 Tax=Heterorhabditis bacteriophora TaxID=37862 RepID=A0A1I7WNG4_HETBA